MPETNRDDADTHQYCLGSADKDARVADDGCEGGLC